jgi:hypothetical protein
MVHLAIVVPQDPCEKVLHLFETRPSGSNLVFLAGTARQPRGDVVLVDIAREDASVLSEDLKELGIARDGSIALEQIDSTAIVSAGVATLFIQRRLYERRWRRHMDDGARAVAGLPTRPGGVAPHR